MSISENIDYERDIGQAVVDVPTAWDARLQQVLSRGFGVHALRGAGSINGIDRAVADSIVADVLEPQFRPGDVIVFDGDPDDPEKPDIGYIAGQVREHWPVLVAQTTDWYYPPQPGSNLTTSTGLQYETFVIPRGQYPGDHNRLTQSKMLANYPNYRQYYIGAAGQIATDQMIDYTHKVPEELPTNITVIKAEINRSLSDVIGDKLATAVKEADIEKLMRMQEQRKRTFGQLWDNEGRFNQEVLNELSNEQDTHELVVLWDLDSPVEKADIVKCRKIELESKEYDKIFEGAQYFVKKRPIMARQVPKGTYERIEVRSGATSDIASEGDWVCRKQKTDGTFGEEYVVHKADFYELYDNSPDSDQLFVPKWDPRKLVQVKDAVIFVAPWGEKQAVRSGGYLLQRTKEDGTVERYGISQADAEADFETVI